MFSVPSAGKSITILDFEILEYISSPKEPVPQNRFVDRHLGNNKECAFLPSFVKRAQLSNQAIGGGGKYYNILPVRKIKSATTVIK